MDLDYLDFICSNSEYHTFLHNTDKDSLELILNEGLLIGVNGNILSNTILQPKNKKKAIEKYEKYKNQNGFENKKIAVVLQIPSEIWKSVNRDYNLKEVSSTKIGYFHPKRKEYVINPEYVIAWINKASNQVHLNPFPISQRRPAKGYEKYQFMMS
jgi:hypothetical protein